MSAWSTSAWLALSVVACATRNEVETAAGSASFASTPPPRASLSVALPALPAPVLSASAPVAAPAAGPCPEGAVRLAGGSFVLKESGRPVTVAEVCFDRLEVVVKDYAGCVRAERCPRRCPAGNAGACTDVPADADWPDRAEAMRASRFCNGQRPDRSDHPLNCVSFAEAGAYCAYRGGRLPSEAEWEWAARGGREARRFPWGPPAPIGKELCWSKRQRRNATCPPGSFERDTTADGVRDMAGNLSEWVTRVGTGGPTLRGASWYSLDDGYVLAAIQGFDSAASRSEVFGFRCAYEPRGG